MAPLLTKDIANSRTVYFRQSFACLGVCAATPKRSGSGQTIGPAFYCPGTPRPLRSGIYHIPRQGAYSRSKELLDDNGLLQEWYKYENSTGETALREWASDEGFAVEQKPQQLNSQKTQ